jgi:hypothetical protein
VLRDSDYAAQGVYAYAESVVRTAQGRYDEAEAALRRQLDLFTASDNWSWQSAALDLAEFLVNRGRHEDAAPLVARVMKAGMGLGIHRRQLSRLTDAFKTAGVAVPLPA